MNNFSALLKQYRERAGLSQSKLAERSGHDHSFLSRLESGARTPTRDAVSRLSEALALTGADYDLMLAASGFLPKDVGSLLSNEPVVGAVLELLQDEAVPLEYRENIRAVMRLLTDQVRALSVAATVVKEAAA